MKWDWILEAKKLYEKETAIIKRTNGGDLSVALVYPNRYSVGMSNLGFHALYALFNKYLTISCERAFYPEKQYVPFFRKEKNLRSLETQKQLHDFDVLAFSISFEPDFLNVVSILQMTNIPLFSRERQDFDPLVFCGGAVTYLNPEPIADFMDFIIIGRAENTLNLVTEAIKRNKTRETLLKKLSEIKGVYVPSIHADPGQHTRQSAGKLISEPVIKNAFFDSAILSEHTEFKNTFLMEIMTGCPFACNFCAVGNCFGKLKYRKAADIFASIEDAGDVVKKVGLIGACINTHPEFSAILGYFRKKNIKIGFSSLRVDRLDEITLDFILNEGNGIITIAPESGSETLRISIGKKMSDNIFYDGLQKAIDNGISSIRLYFMLGLPGEKDEDAAEISRMLTKIRSMRKEKNIQITASIAPFVPKASTGLERAAQADLETINRRLAIIKSGIPAGVNVQGENPKDSILQGILSRGDRKLAQIMEGLNGEISLNGFIREAKKKNIDVTAYLRERGPDEPAGWNKLCVM